MKRSNLVILSAVIFTLIFAAPVLADITEPVRKLNISTIKGGAGTGMIRGIFSFDRYEYTPSNTKDATEIALQAECSLKLKEDIGIGIRIPYRFIENEQVLFGDPNGANKDQSGIGNIVFGATVTLPPPSKAFELAIGANAKFPTADKDVGKEISSIEPYAILLAHDGDLSFTLSVGYELVIDEQDRVGTRDDMYDNTLTLNASVLFSASDALAVGAQLLVTSADEALIEFIPQVRVISSEKIEWGVAILVPINNDYQHGGRIEKSFGVIADVALKF